MTDPMMDFFDDANLFSETLEGLSDDAFVQPGPVSLVDELNLGAEFEPLHIDSLNHVQDAQNQQKMSEFDQLNQYDSLKLHSVNQSFNSSADNVLSPHSQFNCSPVHPQNQSNGMFPDVADGSPMWGHQTATTVSNQNGSPFHQGHSQSMQQNKSFVAHHDFALFQANEPQHQCASLRPQQSRNNMGQDALSQPKDFMEVNVSTSLRVSVNHPPSVSNPSTSQQPLSVQQFSQTASASIHFCGNQEGNFDGQSPTITPCSVSNSQQFSSPYSFSNNHISPTSLLQPTTALSTSQQTHSISDFTGSDAFTSQTGTKQETTEHMLNPNTSLNSSTFQMLHSAHPQGNFSSSKLSPVNINFSASTSSASQISHFTDPIESNGFTSLDDNLLHQVETHSEPFTGLDPDDLLQEDLLPHKQEKANRIISEAIAKAKERGERNIPRVMSPENFPSVSAEGKEEKKGRKVKSKPKDKESKKPKTGSSSKIKEKTKIGFCFHQCVNVNLCDFSSYLHCEWATEQQLLKDKRIQQKIKRFKVRKAQRAHFFADVIRHINSLYTKLKTDNIQNFLLQPVIYYLVKWCSLPYEDSTWELKEDVDQAKIEEFEQLQASRPDSRRLDRPPPNSWKKIEQSREYKNGNQLREYQLEGLNWLLFNWYNRRNCILADEMGLGKTIQSITFLYEILLTGIRGPFLIIAPLSTITNWEREFRTWTDLNVVVYHGSMISRQMIQQYEMYFRDSQGRIVRGTYRFQAIITTFEMILGGCPELNAIEWRCVIIDEAHRLKNKNCKLLEGLKLMNLEHKVLLTGTPLQNTVEELFSLLHFLEPLRFPAESTFMQEFGDLKTEEQVQKLQAILKPMMLRRLKEDVEKKLAPKEETIIEVELTNIQKKYYRAILEKNFAFLSKGAGQANVPNLVNTMMELRKCCNHPYLIKGAEEKILGEFKETYSPSAPDFHLQAMIQSAGKLVLIDKLLPKMKAGGHKVLIFSQMVRCLDILEDYLIHKRYLYERIDGRVRGNLRQAAIDRFSKPDSDRFVFLLCTRAGGLGINLTAADTCIIFDSDWNPQNDLQAQARCHRIGQNKAVKVYRLITRNSYEREMFDRASLKLGLDKAVLQSMSGRENSVGGIQQLSKKEIEDLLRRGAYGAIMDEEDEGSKFCEEDIDQILQRRTKTITIESEGRGSTFAKASFVASGNRTDISLDDPNFWQKWAKKAEIDIDAISGRNSLVIDTPRIRKQTRPFSATKDELAELSEVESEGDEKPKLRRPCDRSNGYGRTECFRVEKNLLVYGWGRWREILSHGRFKRQLNEHDVEIICRALLAYCLVHYRGDEKIKSFIWDLITPTEDGQTRELQNHLGLSAPVPRGRKGKKVKTQASTFDIHKAEWLRKYNPEHLLQDEGYKKHIKHHCNKVLLRVRMLYYLKQEVIGSEFQKVFDGTDASEIDVWVPEPDHSEVPAEWWDADADKSLLIGVFKHGYEKYNTIRADPALCFLERVGKPDEKAVAAEQRANDYMDGYGRECFGALKDVEDPEYKPAPALFKDDIESALTTRLRRLITAYQRTSKNRQAQQIQPTFPVQTSMMQLPYEEAALNPKMAAKIERQWTRREEADFYRVVSTFGVVFDPERGRFDWTKFRAMARLHKKTDESLEKYLYAFMSMCRRVCRLPSKEELVDPNLFIQPITEERASRTLYRIELLRKVREQALRHPQLFERLKLCQPNPDLPVWWECGTHDRDLLIGAAKHGVSRTDYHILRDPELSFMSAQRNYNQNKETQTILKSEPLSPKNGTPIQITDHRPSVKAETDRRMVAARTEPLTPNPASKKQRVSKRGSDSSSDSDSDSDRSSCSSRSSSSSSSSSSSCSHSRSGSSSSSSSSSEGTPHIKAYDEESVASLSTTQDETQDSFQMNNGTPNSSYLLQGGYMLAASYWPKDRVMINRLDSICQTVLKGKWPSARRSYDSTTVASFYTTKLLDSSGAAAEYSEPSAPTPPLAAVKEEFEQSPQLSKEGGLKLTFQKQGLSQKRPFESEECALGQQQYLARLRELQNASETSTSSHLTASANGVIVDSQPVVKKRRGRRKNVEGVDVLFMNRNKHNTWTCLPVAAGINPALTYTQSQGVLDAESPVPVINLKDGTRLAGDDAPKRKDLERWLKEHPGYVEDSGACIPLHDGRPKQKRHRCRNPNKLDVNSLTGEERVQLINRRNARKVGGAFAPPLKDLCRFLKENPEYGVAPEWGEVVKQSGFLPEGMFERILTGPVVREEVSRRGRRPKSEIAKATAAAAAASAASASLNPLLANGLLPGVDLPSLQALQHNLQNLQSLQVTAGLMGMPAGLAAGGEAKNVAAMFPMLLSGMAGLPNLLGMGGLLTKSTESASEEKKGNDSKETDAKKERTEDQNTDTGGENSVSSSPSTSSAAAAANPLSLNPLLLSNILYPGMLLTPGLNLHIPALSQSNIFDVQNSESNDTGSAKPTEEKEENSRVRDQEDKGGTEPSSHNENSTDEGSEKADASSGSDSTSSSSEDSDSSDED
uniref:Chromodomain helicase DNA binding protein 9 n=1 Tax=Cyanoderma ruficeps TaxID=181631 RepID=A0A8C3REM3_9PASS